MAGKKDEQGQQWLPSLLLYENLVVEHSPRKQETSPASFSLCGVKSTTFMIREISPNYQISYSWREALLTSVLMIWQGRSCKTDLSLDYELVPMFSETQSLAPESNFRQLPQWANPEPLPVPK